MKYYNPFANTYLVSCNIQVSVTDTNGNVLKTFSGLGLYGCRATSEIISVCVDENHFYPAMDFNQDCRVDLVDVAMFAVHSLECTAPECD
jgi:hypothetical protein